jgi:hypothetical protein
MEANNSSSTSNPNTPTPKSNVSKQKNDFVRLQKMSFIYNAIQDGWNVKKVRGKYIFTKKHHSKKEYFYDTYLKEFIESNLEASLETILIEKK